MKWAEHKTEQLAVTLRNSQNISRTLWWSKVQFSGLLEAIISVDVVDWVENDVHNSQSAMKLVITSAATLSAVIKLCDKTIFDSAETFLCSKLTRLCSQIMLGCSNTEKNPPEEDDAKVK